MRRRIAPQVVDNIEPWADDFTLPIRERVLRWDAWMAKNYEPRRCAREGLELGPMTPQPPLFVPDRPLDTTEL